MAAKKKSKSKKAQRQNSMPSQHAQQDQSAESNNKPAHISVATKSAVKGEDLIHVSPSRVRFQHSKIRPHFSGCGRSVMETFEEIRRGDLEPADLPPIQVLIGPDENDGLGPWYFSLNNRRLWVLKQCHKEGLLDNERYNNTIPVRVRMPKSGAEAERYSVGNCALEAKFMREGGGGKKKKGKGKSNKKIDVQSSEMDDESGIELEHDKLRDAVESEESFKCIGRNRTKSNKDNVVNENDKHNSDSSESDSDDDVAHDNPFSALF